MRRQKTTPINNLPGHKNLIVDTMSWNQGCHAKYLKSIAAKQCSLFNGYINSEMYTNINMHPNKIKQQYKKRLMQRKSQEARGQETGFE